MIIIIFGGFTYNFSRDAEINREIKPSFATTYLGMYPEILNSSNCYILAFLVRRALYACSMSLLITRPAAQVFILITTSTLMAGLIGNLKPYYFRHNQCLQMFNECSIFVACSMMICFTQNINEMVINTTIIDRKYIGYGIVAVTLIVITVNLCALMSSVAWQIGFRWRRKANIKLKAM